MSLQQTDLPLILLVDDVPSNLHLLVAALKDDYRIKTAVSGQVALELAAREDRPELILLDIMMPEMNGIEVLRRLRDTPDTAGIPVIFVTADNSEQSQLSGLELGADDYLPKPFEPRELLLRVGSLLRRAAPPEQPAGGPVRMGDAMFDPEGARLTKGGKPVKLTGAEAALLQLFAAHAGRPFSRTDLCKRLGVSLERSIDVQVTRLRRKIEEDPKLPLYLQTVRGVGYVLVPDRNG